MLNSEIWKFACSAWIFAYEFSNYPLRTRKYLNLFISKKSVPGGGFSIRRLCFSFNVDLSLTLEDIKALFRSEADAREELGTFDRATTTEDTSGPFGTVYSENEEPWNFWMDTDNDSEPDLQITTVTDANGNPSFWADSDGNGTFETPVSIPITI